MLFPVFSGMVGLSSPSFESQGWILSSTVLSGKSISFCGTWDGLLLLLPSSYRVLSFSTDGRSSAFQRVRQPPLRRGLPIPGGSYEHSPEIRHWRCQRHRTL